MKHVSYSSRSSSPKAGTLSRRIHDATPHWNSAPQTAVELRQIEEFALGYRKKLQRGMVLSGILIVFTLACLTLFIMGFNVQAFFIIGALIISIQMVISGYEFYIEEQRTQRAYRRYLDTFSYQVLHKLRRNATLSSWSKSELESYLTAS